MYNTGIVTTHSVMWQYTRRVMICTGEYLLIYIKTWMPESPISPDQDSKQGFNKYLKYYVYYNQVYSIWLTNTYKVVNSNRSCKFYMSRS